MKIKKMLILFAFFVTALTFMSCNSQNKDVEIMEEKLKTFIAEFEAKYKPIYEASALAYFEASIYTSEENWTKYADTEKSSNAILSNKEDFAKLNEIKESGLITDPILKRQLDLLYNLYLAKQIDINKLNEITELQSEIEGIFNNFRAKVGNKELSDNEIEQILKSSKNSKELQEVWLAHKEIGFIVADKIVVLVKKRNEVARELGFKNYHEMSLKLYEQDPQDIEKLFDELDALTKDAFKLEKDYMDGFLAKELGIQPQEMMPWHYQNRYFQEAPHIYEVDLDGFYASQDLVMITAQYFEGVGLPIMDIIERSDHFPRKMKNQHAFCININKDEKDIRVLCNVVPTARWMETMLHEYGHAVYEKYYDDDLPWLFKGAAHPFTTEAIAMFFGRFATNPQWIQDVIGISEEEKIKIAEATNKMLTLQQLVFSRWSQVMYRFEKSLYENPDQDLNTLWWDLVEQYQMMRRPEGRNAPDWSTKIHIASFPCYYHNYHLGELLASQLHFTIAEKVLGVTGTEDLSFVEEKQLGDFLIKNVFVPGAKYFWNDMIEKATGEKLTAKYYAKQFVK